MVHYANLRVKALEIHQGEVNTMQPLDHLNIQQKVIARN